MEQEAFPKPLKGDIEGEGDRSAMPNNHTPRNTHLGFNWLPGNVCQIVADYISNVKTNRPRCFFLGEQRIALCLSQHFNLERGFCWNFGSLSSRDQWKSSMEVRVAKNYLFTDYQKCLNMFLHENSPFFSIVLEVLVFKLDLLAQNFSSALDDLHDTLDIIDDVSGLRQTVNRPFALKQILSDLRTCRITNQTLSTMELLKYYILKDDKPVSEMYLSKFIISISHCRHRDLLNAIDPSLKFSKLSWLYSLESIDDTLDFDRKLAHWCHAFQLDASKIDGLGFVYGKLPRSYSLEDSPFIERIVMNTCLYSHTMQLPRPSAPLTDAMPRSALIELTLQGDKIFLDLTQLNSGYFPNLTHLCFIHGKITGHLDSQRVPNLKTLRIDLAWPSRNSPFKVYPALRHHTKSIIDADRPWQFVASHYPGGWSLASYDEPMTNPQDDVKEDAPHSPSDSQPFIRELLLVGVHQYHTDEWQAQLNGHPSMDFDAGEDSVGRLVWSPERVEKIAAVRMMDAEAELQFNEVIPGKTRILKSLTSCGVNVSLDGAVLPHLETLELKSAMVTVSGPFSLLKTLSMKEITLKSPWQLDARLLQSLHSDELLGKEELSLHLESLPHLASLRIEAKKDKSSYCPPIVLNGDRLGLSHMKHVKLGKWMMLSPYINQCQMNNVLHLKLSVNVFNLPECWSNTAWQCETLTVTFYAIKRYDMRNLKKYIAVTALPRLPRVKRLTVINKFACQILLNSEMPELSYCKVPSLNSLGRYLNCPALTCIRFTNAMSEKVRNKCLDRATYKAIGAQPKLVYLDFYREVKKMSWNIAPNESEKLILD